MWALLSSAEASIICEVLQANQVTNHLKSAYENVTGDLVIEGTQTYVVENTTVYIDGNIFVRDNATLTIRNSMVILQQRFFAEHWIWILDHSKLLVDNATLGRSAPHNTLLVIDAEAEANIRNSVSEWGIQAVGKVTLENYDASNATNGIFFIAGNITVNNSRINIVEIHHIYSSEKGTFEADGLHPGLTEHLIIEREGSFLEVTNTTVKEWVLDVGEPRYPNFLNVIVTNSELDLWIWFCNGTNVEISNVTRAFHAHWRMSDAWRLEGVTYDIEVVNSTIDSFKLQIIGNALIENASRVQVAPRGSSFVYVKNSVIDYGGLILRGNEHVILEDSEAVRVQLLEDASEAVGRGGIHHLEFRRGIISDSLDIASNYTKIEGNVTIRLSPDRVNWVFGIVDRDFPIVVSTQSGEPLSNTTLALFDSQHRIVWSGTTSEGGIALLNLTFAEGNWTDTLRLEGFEGNYSAAMNVSFLSNTPIVLKMRYFTDLNGDGAVNIMDVSIVAKAFNSKPGCANWNETADLDKNGTINILDVSMVARDYGKTV